MKVWNMQSVFQIIEGISQESKKKKISKALTTQVGKLRAKTDLFKSRKTL